jgi:hypothetical protein
MSSIEYQHTDGDDYITELDYRVSQDEPAKIEGHIPYRHARLSVSLSSDASTLTVTVEILNGLSVLRDDLTQNKLAYDGTATVQLVGHSTVDISITDGSGQSQVDVSSITSDNLRVTMTALRDSPVESDTTTVDLSGGGTTA